MKTDRAPIMVVYGTRPEAIKVAPVIKVLEKQADLVPVVLVTGQHREMLDQVNRVFQINPDIDLNLMQPNQMLNQICGRIFQTIDAEIQRRKPAAILVQGDTTTVMASAIAAFNRRVPVVHLEAGLRSGNLASPFPEEGNRKLVSQIAALHLAPTEQARQNLSGDGVSNERIVVTGNTVIDALKWAVRQPAKFTDPLLSPLADLDRPMLLLTVHRRENLGRPMEEIGIALATLARQHPEMLVVWPAHMNPQVRSAVLPYFKHLDNVLTIEPVGYHEFAHLIRRSYLVLTDSGGLQEEAPSLGKPVLVLRENTERPEGVASGTARLVGTKTADIVSGVNHLLENKSAYTRMAQAVNPYGDGNAAPRCVNAIRQILQVGG